MKLCLISDTHTKHQYIGIKKYDADVLVHCGDISGNGGIAAITDFLEWFNGLEQFKHKIFIAGNHDWLFERNNSLARQVVEDVGKGDIIYLENESVVIDNIKFYGTPVQPPFCNWAFNVFEPKLTEYWKIIDDDTDVLITHSPPYMIGDYVPYSMQHEGSPSLYKEVVERIKPRLHAFGHIHEGYGQWDIDDIKFVNASSLDADYVAVNDPIIVEI
jgi:Icc-related predicted phosphoesterase